MFYQKFFSPRKKIAAAAEAVVCGVIYSKLYSPIPDHVLPASKDLSERVNLQARQMGVEQPIKVYTSKSNSGAFMGVNGPGKWNSMAIILNQEAEEDHDRFIMSHEIAHAKNNDPLMTNLIILAGFNLSFLNIPIVFPVLIAWGGFLAYSRHAEKRADTTAAASIKNIETVQAIQWFSERQSRLLHYRNSSSDQPWDGIKKKLMVSSTGDHLFNFTFPFVDTHPSYTSRINYLTQFIKQRPDNDPIIEVFYKAGEHEPLTPILITKEQSSLLRQIIQNSPKNRIHNSLGKIVLHAEHSIGTVQLFKYGKSFFSPFNFELDVVRNPNLLPAIIETIMHSPQILTTRVEAINDDEVLEFEKELRQALKIEADEQVNSIKVSGNPISEANRYVFYTGKQLNLISNKCFDDLDNTKKTGPSL